MAQGVHEPEDGGVPWIPWLRGLLDGLSPDLRRRGREASARVPADFPLPAPGRRLRVRVPASASRAFTVTLVPSARVARCSCSTSGATSPCKHVVAVLEILAERLAGTALPERDPGDSGLALAAIDRVLALAPAPRPREESELHWRVRLGPREVTALPWLRSRGRDVELDLPSFGRLPRAVLATPQDARVARLVAYASALDGDDAVAGSAAVVGVPSEPSAFDLLDLLEGHPRLFVDGASGPCSLVRARPSISFEPQGEGTWRALPALDGESFVPCEGAASVGLEGMAWLATDEHRLRYAPLDLRDGEVVATLAGLPPALPSDVSWALLDRLERAGLGLDLRAPDALRGKRVEADARTFLLIEPRPQGALVRLRVRPVPGGRAVDPGLGPASFAGFVDGERRRTERDLAGERARAEEVADRLRLPRDPVTGEPPIGRSSSIARDEAVLDVLERVREDARADVVVEWPEGAVARRVVPAAPTSFRVSAGARQDWFGLEGGVEVEGDVLALGALLAAIRDGRRYLAVGDGRFVALERIYRERGGLADLALVARAAPGGGVEVSRAALGLLAPALDGLEVASAPAAWRDAVARSLFAWRGRADDAPALAPPAGLEASLRPYQLEGYRWLRRLATLGVGACLADEMGLGKTVQAIALLLARRGEGPALVVAPTSVGFNWARELARFAPSLRPIPLAATSNRASLVDRAEQGEVVLASWGLLQRERDALAAVEWGTVVFDEAQAIKNAVTKRAQAARSLRARFSLALTGTPVENHLGELWSLFAVVAPGVLGSFEQFAERFARPIELAKSAERREALARLVRPFVLRRTKAQVLRDLPARTEVREDVVLSKLERAFYERTRLEAIAEIGLASQEGRDQRLTILAALTRLRQIACHPRLVDPEAPRASAKLDALEERLAEVLEGGHRALVFSQFTRHLALVEAALSGRGVRTLYLDGQTPVPERARRVDAFQRGDAPVFLISLRAGGTGLNLTAADYVFLLDPWWNPAVEDQAADRAHRIGQTRPVTVVRFVARGTIEEKVLALHEEKRDLVAGVLDGADGAARLSTGDLLDLLREGVMGEAEEEPEPEGSVRGGAG